MSRRLGDAFMMLTSAALFTPFISAASTTIAPTGTTAVKPANTLTYSATYTPGSLPVTSEQGQTGTNQCGTVSRANSTCQNLFINSVEDFCLYGPPVAGSSNTIGDTEEIEVAYCTKEGYGTRLFPDGTITGAHFVMTPDYVQVTGVGDFTKIGVPAGDEGGELDPHGATGNGNPIGGLVFGNSYGKLQQYHEWTNFMAYNEFCLRACNPEGPNPAGLCNHIYDVQGCAWNMPANYDPSYFEDCLADSSLPMGVYGTSTWYQSDGPPTPSAHPIPPSSSCVRVASLTSASVAPTSDAFSTVFSTSSTAGSVVTFVKDVVTLTSVSSLGATATGTTAGTTKSTTTTTAGTSSASKQSAAQGQMKGPSGSTFVVVTVMASFGLMVGLLAAV